MQLKQNLSHRVHNARRQLKNIERHPYIASGYHILSSRLQDTDEMKMKIDTLMNTIQAKVRLKVLAKSQQLEALKPINQIKAYKDKFAQMDRGLKSGIASQIYQRKTLLDRGAVFQKIDQKIMQDIRQKKSRLEMLSSHLRAVNPKNLLNQGYCILFSEKKIQLSSLQMTYQSTKTSIS
jgi:exodeoxyribonuclease VII large subunit